VLVAGRTLEVDLKAFRRGLRCCPATIAAATLILAVNWTR
jgi:hypothetical protein